MIMIIFIINESSSVIVKIFSWYCYLYYFGYIYGVVNVLHDNIIIFITDIGWNTTGSSSNTSSNGGGDSSNSGIVTVLEATIISNSCSSYCTSSDSGCGDGSMNSRKIIVHIYLIRDKNSKSLLLLNSVWGNPSRVTSHLL